MKLLNILIFYFGDHKRTKADHLLLLLAVAHEIDHQILLLDVSNFIICMYGFKFFY